MGVEPRPTLLIRSRSPLVLNSLREPSIPPSHLSSLKPLSQPPMSPDSDYFSFYYPGESTYADGPPPESFDNEFGNVEFDWSPEQLDKLFSPSCVTVPVITTPPTLTYSTESASQSSYSYTFSDYSFPSDPSTGVDGMHDSMSIYSNMFYNGPPSFGPLPPSPPPHPARALLDNGTSADYQVSFGVSPDDISPPVQLSVTPVAPAIPQVMSDTQEPIAPRKPYKCPRCPFGKAMSMRLYCWLTVLASLRAQL